MKKFKYVFLLIVLITAAMVTLALYGLQIGNKDKSPIDLKGIHDMRFGIDIRGGVEAVYQPKDLKRKPTNTELESARSIMETRLDYQNILDREVTIDKKNKAVIIRFPWKSTEKEFDAAKAISELGETAVLTFRDPSGNVLLDGKHVTKSDSTYQQSDSQYVVNLTFDKEGTTAFADATTKFKGQKIGIFMDENMISNPTVNDAITDGKAIITGMANADEANSLANKIRSGSLPFAMESSSNTQISPSLGKGALDVMVKAGIVAFILVCIFMILYYRLLGVIACIALTIQATGQLLAVSIPQFTLTLPGIAAIILSIGMGVDANVIISERIKEELKSGKSLPNAIKSGFHQAFSSVFDGNITVILVAFILMWMGSGSMKSFGYSMLTGVLLNFVAGVTASRLMVLSASSFKAFSNPVLYGAKKEKNVI